MVGRGSKGGIQTVLIPVIFRSHQFEVETQSANNKMSLLEAAASIVFALTTHSGMGLCYGSSQCSFRGKGS